VEIFKNKAFTRFARRTGIRDTALCETIRDAERGLIAADLGGGVIKQRIARPGQGKSGGFPFMASRKAGRGTSGPVELAALKKLASELLGYDDKTVAQVVASGPLIEVMCDAQTIP
jgi:hypothetical protein